MNPVITAVYEITAEDAALRAALVAVEQRLAPGEPVERRISSIYVL
jgi:hypothetical protein